MTTLSDTITRVRVVLDDAASSRYSDGEITEALRQVLSEYSNAYPNIAAAEVTFAAPSRFIALEDGAGDPLPIKNIVQLFCPYDDTDVDPPVNEAYYYYNKEGVPYLHISGGYIPQTDDVARILYSTSHTMGGLDSETVDTYPADHANLLVIGASAVAAMHRAAGLSESVGSRSSDTNQLEHWAKSQYDLFETLLEALRAWSGRQPAHDSQSSWTLDSWDIKRDIF